jgi:hypothetical protein
MNIEQLSEQIADLRRDLDIRFARIDAQFNVVDAKLDAKPNLGAMYQAVAALSFGIGGVITSTVVILKALGKL